MTDNKSQRLLLIAQVHHALDLLPFLNLGGALAKDGWAVAVAAHGTHEAAAQPAQRVPGLVKFYPLDGEPEEYLGKSVELRASFYGSSTSGLTGAVAALKQSGLLRAPFDQYAASNMELVWRAATDHGADALLCCSRTLHEARAVGQRLNVPVFVASAQPSVATAAHAPVAVQGTMRPRFGFVNRLAHWGARQMTWVSAGDRLNRFRRTIGLNELTELDEDGLSQLMLFSAAVVERPDDWDEERVAVVGFVGACDHDADRLAGDAPLKAFLDGGPAPVVVHFGALPVPERAAETVAEALDSLTLRGVLCGGWAAAARSLGDHVFVCDQLPVAALSRCAAAVHAGDAVTTGLSLCAGLPQAVMPLFPESYFWAQRCQLLGVGPPGPPTPLTELTAPSLIRLVSAVNNETTRTVAANLADRLRGEDALQRSCAWIRARFQLDRNCGVTMGPDGWVKDEDAPRCQACDTAWSFSNRRHHCRGGCGGIFCADCLALDEVPNYAGQVMVCKRCFEARNYMRDTGEILIQS